MYVDTFMLVVSVSLFSVTFSIIQWGVNKVLDELYWNLYRKRVDKRNEDAHYKAVFGEDELDWPTEYPAEFEEEEVEYYVAEREEK